MRPLSPALFHGRHFDRSIIILCVRWYITYKLSYRDLVEMMAERGVDVSHTTILRWVQCYVPEFEKRWDRHARPVSTSWRVDETYIRVRGRWTYLYLAVDRQGLTVDFLLSERRDIAAAKRFFRRAIGRHGAPERITLDGYPATHAAIAKLKKDGALCLEAKVWTSKYLGNYILASPEAEGAQWDVRPSQLVNLLEMIKKYGQAFYRIGQMLAVYSSALRISRDTDLHVVGGVFLDDANRAYFKDNLTRIMTYCEAAELTFTAKAVQRILDTPDDKLTLEYLVSTVPELEGRFLDELEPYYFLHIPKARFNTMTLPLRSVKKLQENSRKR
jgi:transposase-like protein